jgi:hypothetical protein
MSGGDTLLIQAGTYDESMHTWASGTASAYTRYARYQNDQVIVQPTSGSSNVYIDGSKHYTRLIV